MRLLILREHPGGGIEVALAEDPAQRGLLWTRPAPAGAARARVLASGVWEGAPAWLESRPAGALLSEIGPLSAPEFARVLLDIAERLQRMHRAETYHGRLDADHVVVDERGRAHLIGASSGGAGPDVDARHLRALLLEGWPDDASPDPGEGQPLEVLAESLDGWLDYECPDHTNADLGRRSREREPLPTETRVVEWESDPAAAHADEVSYALGPDTEITGMFSDNTGLMDFTREVTQGLEPTGADGRQRLRAQARLMAPLVPGPEMVGEGQPSQAILALISIEPIEPLPLPDGVEIHPLAPPLANTPLSGGAATSETGGGAAPPRPAQPRRWGPWIWLSVGVIVGGLGFALLRDLF